jgi:hypothetical protein
MGPCGNRRRACRRGDRLPRPKAFLDLADQARDALGGRAFAGPSLPSQYCSMRVAVSVWNTGSTRSTCA